MTVYESEIGRKGWTWGGRATSRVHSPERTGRQLLSGPLILLPLLVASGCTDSDLELGRIDQAATVGSLSGSGCSTSVVLPLSKQIAEEMVCMAPGSLVAFAESASIEFRGSAVLPYLSPQAKADLEAAAAAYGGTIRINSGLRTVVQQYVIYRWKQDGRCGITAVATPGRSNHETGRAVDIQNYSSAKSVLEAHGWDQSVPGDPVHFDHLGSADLRGMDVHAFQRLWNRNNPGDLIDEDGAWGSQTSSRLARSPGEGFAIGPCPASDPNNDPNNDPSNDPNNDPNDPGVSDPRDPYAQGDDQMDTSEPDYHDGSDAPRDNNEILGGCSASSGTSGATLLPLALIALVALRRRRTT